MCEGAIGHGADAGGDAAVKVGAQLNDSGNDLLLYSNAKNMREALLRIGTEKSADFDVRRGLRFIST